MNSTQNTPKTPEEEAELRLQQIYSQTSFRRSHSVKKAIDLFLYLKKDHLLDSSKGLESIRIAGRVLKIRDLGSLTFADFADETGSLQLKIQKGAGKVESFGVGDIVGLLGKLSQNNKGQLVIEVEEIKVLSKCLLPFPDLYHGFSNVETRFRERYLDFIANPKTRSFLATRHQITRLIRDFLDNDLGFLEAETPILVSQASGAQARPFITSHNKLQKNFFLRIATEIHLKQLLVGGFEKVYEMGRIFRNEGIDARHNPEFTSIEVYAAFEEGEYMINLTEKLFQVLTQKLLKPGQSLSFNSCQIDLFKPFERISMKEAVKKYAKVDFDSIDDPEKALEIANWYGIFPEPFQKTIGHIMVLFFEKYVEKNLINPTFVTDFPVEVSPLAKTKKGEAGVADRFELYIAKMEFANGYSELNDPREQEKRFREQIEQKNLGNEEVAYFDEEFVKALKYGLPPAAGMGMGIDRLVMLFTENDSIKEVIAFPQLKDKKT